MNIKPLTSQWNKPRLATQSCASCNAFLPNKQANPKAGEPRQGWCRAAPPGIIQTVVQGPLGPHGPQMIPAMQGVWPPTNTDGWCRSWEGIDDESTPAA